MVQSTHSLVVGDYEVVKTYVDWTRGEPEREWRALTLLHEYARGLSPQPIRRGTVEGRPFVVMSRLPGQPLGEQPLTPAQVVALGEAMRRMYRSVPAVAEPAGDRVFALGDGNLGTVLWDGASCYLVDFEDSGSSDIAYEVADLVEHVSVWLDGFVTPDALVPYLMLTADDRRRLLLGRRLFAICWLLMLLPDNPAHARNPKGTLERQARRVVDLMP